MATKGCLPPSVKRCSVEIFQISVQNWFQNGEKGGKEVYILNFVFYSLEKARSCAKQCLILTYLTCASKSVLAPQATTYKKQNKKLSLRRQTARRFVSLNIVQVTEGRSK